MSNSPEQAREQIDALVKLYNQKVEGLSESERREALTEDDVIHHFIVPLLTALGWPTTDLECFKYEKHTPAGKPDITMIPERGGTLYVEGKRLTVIKDFAASRSTQSGLLMPGQMALPGMAVDRTKEEQQAINYAFENNGNWAILTSFEKLRLFNARRDWLVFSFEKPGAYLTEFDQLWELSYQRILEGSLDTLSNQRYREDVDSEYLALINEWRERLARDIIGRLDQNAWARRQDGELDLDVLRAVVQRVLDRLVVVRFAEDHFVIPADTLKNIYEHTRTHGYTFTLREHIQQLFRQFDDRHNSALFAPDYADEAAFSDEVLGGLIERLYGARFRAMTPDIMGNTYEQYLGKTLVRDNGSIKTADNLETRKKQGSYYTPQVIVRYLVDNSLGRFLYGTANGKADGEPLEGESRRTYSEIASLKVLDPACGSGSFLIYAYEVLAEFYRGELARIQREAEAYGQQRAAEGLSLLEIEGVINAYQNAHLPFIQTYPRLIVEKHLYGVDLDPQAAEIATVNLMMRAMADLKRERQGEELPLILNQNVKVGNSLVGTPQLSPLPLQGEGSGVGLGGEVGSGGEALAEIARLRAALTQYPHTSPEYQESHRRLAELTAQSRAALDEPIQPHFSDLTPVRPFHWAVEFPEVFVDEAGQYLGEAAGFDVLIGNPPWEIVKPDLREFYAQFDPEIESHLNRKQAEQRIMQLQAEDPARERLWEMQSQRVTESAAYYSASAEYTRQGRGDRATHKLFMERAWGLLKDGGRLGYVVPSGIYTDLGTKELREMLLNEGSIEYLYSFSNERFFFAGVHHAFKFALVGAHKGVQSDGFWAAFRFNPRVAVQPDELPNFLSNHDNLIYVRNSLLPLFNPDSLAVMEFQIKRDYDVAETIYNDWGLLGQNLTGQWELKFAREFDMANDAHLFNQSKRGLPLYEGKMIHQFDSFFASPQYWIEPEKGFERLAGSEKADWHKGYRFAFREVSGTVNERTCIGCVLPPHVFAGHTLWVGTAPDTQILLFYLSTINSLIIDWLVRSKGATHVTLFLMKSLPIPRLTPGNPYFDALVPRAARLTCTRPEFADLWQEVMGKKWQESDGATSPTDRQRLRDEIDALVAHLYGLSREDFEHILGTFPLVFPDDQAGQDKKGALLAVYDEFEGVVEGWARG
jgi:predicted type IV restriction endonuclease